MSAERPAQHLLDRPRAGEEAWQVDSGVDASIGTVGDALDNALAESLIGLYKTELIKPRGPWHNIREVDVATAAWVDWYNNRRLHGACQGRPPVEFETLYELGDLISLVA